MNTFQLIVTFFINILILYMIAVSLSTNDDFVLTHLALQK